MQALINKDIVNSELLQGNQLEKITKLIAISKMVRCPVTKYILSNYSDVIAVYDKKRKNTRQTYFDNGLYFVKYLVDNDGFYDDFLFSRFVGYLTTLSDYQNTNAARCNAAKHIVKQVNKLNTVVLPDAIYGRLMKFDGWIQAEVESTREGQENKHVEHIKDQLEKIEDHYRRYEMKAQFVLMAIQGLRASEIVNLKMNDLDLRKKEKTAKIVLKGGKRKTIFLFDAVVLKLKSYIKYHGIQDGYLFTHNSKPMSRQLLRGRWKKFFKDIGQEKYSIHDFRHYIGTEEAKKGNAFGVKARLNHASIVTSQRYVDKAAERFLYKEQNKNITY